MVDASKNSSTAAGSNDGEFDTSTTVSAPAITSARPSTVTVLTPEAGDAATTCKLINGPIRDFNLMVARVHAQGGLEIISLGAGEAKELPRKVTALHVLDGSVEFAGELLATGDTWIAENAAALTISTSRPSRLALVTLQPKGGAA